MEPSSNSQKKIRIICSDHHATDSSTDEERDMNKRKNRIQGIERFVKENSYSPVTFVSSNENGERALRKFCMSTGVRLRPSGKFSSQIRDPFKKKCVCLGTYSTEEEAAAAYQKKKREFEIKKASKKNKNSSAVPSSSVLDVNAIEVEVNNQQKAMKDQQVTIKKFVKEYEFVQESETTKGKEVSVKDLLKDDGSSIMVLWEPPSASDSWDELFGQCGFGDHMTNLRHHLLLNDNCINHLPETADLIELPDMEIDNEDMAWVDEILT